MAYYREPLTKKQKVKAGKKIAILIKEGKPKKQAVAIAYSMQRKAKKPKKA